MVGTEGTKIFDFDNPRLLEKALSGTAKIISAYWKVLKYLNYFSKILKKYLGRFFWAPILVKRYQNMSGFTGVHTFCLKLEKANIED